MCVCVRLTVMNDFVFVNSTGHRDARSFVELPFRTIQEQHPQKLGYQKSAQKWCGYIVCACVAHDAQIFVGLRVVDGVRNRKLDLFGEYQQYFDYEHVYPAKF